MRKKRRKNQSCIVSFLYPSTYHDDEIKWKCNGIDDIFLLKYLLHISTYNIYVLYYMQI